MRTPIPGVELEERWLGQHEQTFERLVEEVAWEGSMSARKTASFGVPYNYAQMVYPKAPMHPRLQPIVDRLTQEVGSPFNNCLLNFYPDGRSKMGFHSDATEDLVPESRVAIVSLGGRRPLSFRGRDDPERRHTLWLESGSLLTMTLDVQHQWAHAIKRRRFAEPRISLTWRAFRWDGEQAAAEGA